MISLTGSFIVFVGPWLPVPQTSQSQLTAPRHIREEMCPLRKLLLCNYCHCTSWLFWYNFPPPQICRSDVSMQLPAASVKIISTSGNDFSRVAATTASGGFCSGHPATQNSHLNSADSWWERGSKCCFLHYSTSFSVSSTASSSPKIVHKFPDFFPLLLSKALTPLQTVFQTLGWGFPLFWPPLNPVEILAFEWLYFPVVSAEEHFFHDFYKFSRSFLQRD